MKDVKELKSSKRIIAHIEAFLKNGALLVLNSLENRSTCNAEFAYTFNCACTGRSGTMVNRQSGKAMAAAGQKRILSKTALSFIPGDQYCIDLVIFSQGEQIAEHSLSFP
ncbi:hypothetical protein TH63_09900 [Rufibacter radiotolerans]|uniref:Uncharacterized protein n=1 Tax=Rufibacter radiotolerans TaxID=1379910 RepID=A0A0H4VQ73_9BACT|nr:curli-like amyloid fiber formation chaperone CsgH [Rufibacter radiotolerans]AKQ45884.1 hypothetical protein TH63_09900 [Rufibacter radiotolerans]